MAEVFNMTEETFRNIINMPEEDDSDSNTTSFIDYFDAGVRAAKHIKNRKMNEKEHSVLECSRKLGGW